MTLHTVKHKQSLLDIALERYGTVAGLFDLIEANQLNGPTDNAYVGMSLVVPRSSQKNNRIVNYLSTYTVATLSDAIRATGIGWMVCSRFL